MPFGIVECCSPSKSKNNAHLAKLQYALHERLEASIGPLVWRAKFWKHLLLLFKDRQETFHRYNWRKPAISGRHLHRISFRVSQQVLQKRSQLCKILPCLWLSCYVLLSLRLLQLRERPRSRLWEKRILTYVPRNSRAITWSPPPKRPSVCAHLRLLLWCRRQGAHRSIRFSEGSQKRFLEGASSKGSQIGERFFEEGSKRDGSWKVGRDTLAKRKPPPNPPSQVPSMIALALLIWGVEDLN